MKNFLIAFSIFILASCSDPRAKDIEKLVAIEMLYGDITDFEAECMLNIFSDAIDDDDLWDWLVAESLTPSPSYGSAQATKYEIEIGIILISSLDEIRDDCGFDYVEVMKNRGIDLGL